MVSKILWWGTSLFIISSLIGPNIQSPNSLFCLIWVHNAGQFFSMRHVHLCYSDLPVELVASIAAFAKKERKILSDKESFIVYKNFIRLIIIAPDSPTIMIWSLSIIITSKSTFDAVDVIDIHVTSQIHMPSQVTDPQHSSGRFNNTGKFGTFLRSLTLKPKAQKTSSPCVWTQTLQVIEAPRRPSRKGTKYQNRKKRL